MDRLRDGLLARLRSNPKAEMPFLDHLEELRWRILKSLAALVVGTGVAVFLILYYDVAALLIRPAHLVLGEDFKLINLSPPDTFFVLLQMSLILGFVFASPIVFYHVWVFLAPALEKHERRAIVPALWMGLVLFAGGVCWSATTPFPTRYASSAGSSRTRSKPRIRHPFIWASSSKCCWVSGSSSNCRS